MEDLPFSVHNARSDSAAVEGLFTINDGSDVRWAMSRREFGPMSFKGRTEWDVASNRMQFLRIFRLKIDNLVSPYLLHTPNVVIVGKSDKRRGARELKSAFPGVDGLVTREKNIVLMTTHADCPAVWMCVPEQGWIGVAHAGREGILKGIVENLIDAVPEAERQGMVLAIGPGICTDHYEVSQEIARQFQDHLILNEAVKINRNKYYLDLKTGIKLIGQNRGCKVIESPWKCTFENSYLSSFRRDGQSFAPMAAIITRI